MSADTQFTAAARRLGPLTGAIGIVSGWSLFFLWWERSAETSPLTTLFIALISAAIAAAIFEALVERIREPQESWSVGRFATTMVVCFTAEAIAAGAEALTHAGFHNVTATTGMVFGSVLPTGIHPAVNVVVLIGFWVAMGVTIGVQLSRYVRRNTQLAFPVEEGDAARKEHLALLWRSARSNGVQLFIRAGLSGLLAALGYILVARGLATIFLAFSDRAAMTDTIDLLLLKASGEWYHLVVQVLLQPTRVLFEMDSNGVRGLVYIMILLGSAAAWVKKAVGFWIAVPMAILLVAPSTISPDALRSLGVVLFDTFLIWALVGGVLGVVTPFLSLEARNPRVWGAVGWCAAALLVLATILRSGDLRIPAGLSPVLLFIIGATVVSAVLLWLRVLRPQDVIPLLALYVGIGAAGLAGITSSVGLYRIQERSWRVIELPRVVQPGPRRPIRAFEFYAPAFADTVGSYGVCQPLPRAGLTRFRSLLTRIDTADVLYQLQWARTFTTHADTSLPSGILAARGWDSVIRVLDHESDSIANDEPRSLAIRREGLAHTSANVDAIGREVKLAKASLGTLASSVASHRACLDSLTAHPIPEFLTLRLTMSRLELATLGGSIEVTARPFDALDSLVALSTGRIDSLTTVIRKAAANQLELVMVGSLGFWLTLGLLATWRSTSNGREQSRVDHRDGRSP